MFTQSQRVEIIDPVQIVPIGSDCVGHVLELRPGLRVECPALGAVIAGGGGAVQHLAFPAIETGELIGAGEHGVHSERSIEGKSRAFVRSSVDVNDATLRAGMAATRNSRPSRLATTLSAMWREA